MEQDNVKHYDKCTPLEKKARDYFNVNLCTNCFVYKEGSCYEREANICINAYTKGFVKGVKHHRKIVKRRNKK